MKILRVLFVAVLMLGFSQTHAQLVKFGIKGGLNFPSLNDLDGNYTFESNNGWHAGATVLINIPVVKVGADALYSHSATTVSGTSSGDVKVYIIDIPVFAKLNFLKILSIHAGPSFSWANTATLDGVDILDGWEEQNVKFVAGAGVNLGPFDIHGRFIFPSRTNLNINNATSEIKNSNIQLSLTYFFNNKG